MSMSMITTLDGVRVMPGQRWRALSDRDNYTWRVIATQSLNRVLMLRDPPSYRDAHAGMPIRNTTYASRMHEWAPGEGWVLVEDVLPSIQI